MHLYSGSVFIQEPDTVVAEVELKLHALNLAECDSEFSMGFSVAKAVHDIFVSDRVVSLSS